MARRPNYLPQPNVPRATCYRFQVRHLQAERVQVTMASKPAAGVNHSFHFVLTLLTFGLWGVVWWWLIIKAEGKDDFFSGFDDDYWSYLIECEQPPAALYRQQVASDKSHSSFDA